MEMDILSVSAMTAVVVIVAGVVFILETLFREDDIVSRLWSIGFLSGILASVSYVIWAFTPDAWGAVAIGNAAFVSSSGFMWLGCRSFNNRTLGWAGIVVAAFTVTAGVAVLLEGPQGGSWAGAEIMFLALCLLPAAAASEMVRGSLVGIRTSISLAVVFGAQAIYYLARLIVLLATGRDGETFTQWWGTIPTSVLTITLTVVAVVITSLLRAERTGLRGRRTLTAPGTSFSGVLEPRWFERFAADAIERGAPRAEILAVISTRIDDLPQVVTAFGASEAEDLRTAWYRAVRLYAPTQAWIGDDGSGGIAISTVVESEADARRLAASLHSAIYDALDAVEGSVLPVLGVGVALSDVELHDAGSLISRARAAAAEAALSEDSSVVVAAPEDTQGVSR
ncbi:hypothetical protein [Microbacterium sp. TWP3-1-2b2]|uniref:hypothetical protein n=1 Tax=Microbacterium sp. TWP3-1-2b2 TaxID=2804651 RepID=UPI003CEE0001